MLVSSPNFRLSTAPFLIISCKFWYSWEYCILSFSCLIKSLPVFKYSFKLLLYSYKVFPMSPKPFPSLMSFIVATKFFKLSFKALALSIVSWGVAISINI